MNIARVRGAGWTLLGTSESAIIDLVTIES